MRAALGVERARRRGCGSWWPSGSRGSRPCSRPAPRPGRAAATASSPAAGRRGRRRAPRPLPARRRAGRGGEHVGLADHAARRRCPGSSSGRSRCSIARRRATGRDAGPLEVAGRGPPGRRAAGAGAGAAAGAGPEPAPAGAPPPPRPRCARAAGPPGRSRPASTAIYARRPGGGRRHLEVDLVGRDLHHGSAPPSTASPTATRHSTTTPSVTDSMSGSTMSPCPPAAARARHGLGAASGAGRSARGGRARGAAGRAVALGRRRPCRSSAREQRADLDGLARLRRRSSPPRRSRARAPRRPPCRWSRRGGCRRPGPRRPRRRATRRRRLR